MDAEQWGECEKCGHAYGPHVLVATMNLPELGGLVFCNILGCRCQSTWSVEGQPMPWVPPDEDIELLRHLAQDDDVEPTDQRDWTLEEGTEIEID